MRYKTSQVTILLPIYCVTPQSVQWLDECLVSIAKQGCAISCYNDGSTEGLVDVLSKYDITSYGFSRTNYGVSYARNRCVEKVKTPLIYPMDCDDVMVDGAIDMLLKVYDGTPMYSDIFMWGPEVSTVYRLPDFSCETALQKLGYASVNVLHTVEQWKSIGGWDESMALYEDAEYNARLMLRYCGVKYNAPLIKYRQHGSQRTKVHTDRVTLVKHVLDRVKGYDTMCASGGCGGKNRRSKVGIGPTVTTTVQSQKTMKVASTGYNNLANSLPGKNGKMVRARYIGGKGMGPHYYRGLSTNYQYRVTHGVELDVDYTDTRLQSDRPGSLLIRLEELPQGDTFQPEVKVEALVAEKITRTPVLDVVKTPVTDGSIDSGDKSTGLPDIRNMSVRQIQHENINQEQARTLLITERNGRNRVKVIAYLEGLVK